MIWHSNVCSVPLALSTGATNRLYGTIVALNVATVESSTAHPPPDVVTSMLLLSPRTAFAGAAMSDSVSSRVTLHLRDPRSQCQQQPGSERDSIAHRYGFVRVPRAPPTDATTAASATTESNVVAHVDAVRFVPVRPGPISHDAPQPSVASVIPRTTPTSAAARTEPLAPARAIKKPVPA